MNKITSLSRSGSTFLLSLMTVEEKIACFSEPFFDIMQEQFVKGPGNVEDKVNDLMDCKFETFSTLSRTKKDAKGRFRIFLLEFHPLVYQYSRRQTIRRGHRVTKN